MNKSVKILRNNELPPGVGIYYQLTCLAGARKGESYLLEGKRIIIGRSQDSDIKTFDLKSSREHAEIVLIDNKYIVSDLKSQNGIYINDLKIKQHVLKDNDKLIIGETIYRFSVIERKASAHLQVIDGKQSDDILSAEDENEEQDTENPKKKSKLLVFAIIGALLVLVLIPDENKKSDNKNKKELNKVDVSDPFVENLSKRKNENNQVKEKLNLYFQRGLREFREENYYRAMNEFKSALSWSPGDPLAEFYLRKTKDKLNKMIQDQFNAAARDEESLKLNSAVVSFCSIIRLLENFKSKEDFDQIKKAQEGIKRIEQKMFLDEGQLNCDNVKVQADGV
jgi:pSer/pThr/pTyr-binding forkhead associated (FHA) protein